MEADGDITYDIPGYSFVEYSTIENGILKSHNEIDKGSLEYMFMSQEERGALYKKMFKITVIRKDCIEINSYRNEKTYTLWKQ